MSGLALAFILVSAVAFPLAGGRLPLVPLALRAAIPVLLLLGILFYRWRRERRIVGLLTIVFWSLTLGVLYLPPMYLAARCPVPFQDDALASMDRALGVEVTDILRLTEAFPGITWFLGCCYDSLLFLLIVAIILPPLCGKMRRAKEYLIAGVVSAALSIPIFAVLPARGPWCYYGYEATPDQAKVTEVLTALKSEDTFVLNLCATEGIISFPSFHTVLALLAAFALWSVPYVRWPAAILAGLIVVSTVTTGWHYPCDILSGVVIAAVACLVARGYSWLEARNARPGCPPEH
jgi:membrane-associated phospholipid phosphatase